MPHDLSLEQDDPAPDCEIAVPISADAAATSKFSSYVWELCYLRGTWVPYPQDTCQLLEGVSAPFRPLPLACSCLCA